MQRLSQNDDLGGSIGIANCADIIHSTHPADATAVDATIDAAGVRMTHGGVADAATKMSGYAKQRGMLTVMANYASESGGYATGTRSAIWDTSAIVANINDPPIEKWVPGT